MSLEPLTREQRQADYTIVTSEQPDVIKRALDMEGATDVKADEAAGDKAAKPTDKDSALDKGKSKSPSVTAKSGDDSDSSVDAGDGDATDDTVDEPSDQDDEDSSDDDVDAQAKTDKDGKPVKKKSSGIEKRFSKLTAQIEEANRKNEELQKRLEAAEKAKTVEPAKEDKKLAAATDTVEKFTAKPAPEEKDFSTYGEFVAATSKWAKEAVEDADTHAEKRAAKLVQDAVGKLKEEWQSEQAKSKAEAEVAKVITAYEKRVAIIAADPLNKDFESLVTNNVNKVQLTPTMKQQIVNGESGPMPELALYFGRNPKEAARIGTLSETGQLLAIGAIITKINAPASKPAKTATATNGGTRKPSEPLPRGSQAGGRGTGAGASRRNADTLSADDYIAQRRAGTLK